MDYNKIAPQFGSWSEMFREFIEGEGLSKIFGFLKLETKKGKIILPESVNVFRSFSECPREKVKCLIIGQDPYNTKTKEGKVIANGIPLSCELTGSLQPSLEQWYMAIEEQYKGFDPDMDFRPDNSYLLVEEGVLLLNSSLTVEYLKPGSHEYIWLPFMQYFIEEIINKYYRGLPIVLLGGQAQKLEKFINPLMHHVLKVEHPAAASHQNRKWNTNNLFNWVDKIIEANNGPSERIRWYRIKGDDDYDNMPEFVKKDFSNKGTKSGKELGLPFD